MLKPNNFIPIFICKTLNLQSDRPFVILNINTIEAQLYKNSVDIKLQFLWQKSASDALLNIKSKCKKQCCISKRLSELAKISTFQNKIVLHWLKMIVLTKLDRKYDETAWKK